MTWNKTVQTEVGVMAYHILESQNKEKIRLHVGSSFADLNAEERRDLAEYLLDGLDNEVS